MTIYNTNNDFIQHTTIGIYSIFIGNYIEYYEPFIENITAKFLTGCDLRFFIVTDHLNIKKYKNINYVFVNSTESIWPLATLNRYTYFLLFDKNSVLECDYLFFMNSNTVCVDNITYEDVVLNKDYIFSQHHCYIDSKYEDTPFEKNNISTAFVNFDSSKKYTYVGGRLFGAKSDKFIELCELLSRNVTIDMKKKYIAVWHDESHINCFFNTINYGKDNFTLLDVRFHVPECFKNNYKNIKIMCFEKKIITSAHGPYSGDYIFPNNKNHIFAIQDVHYEESNMMFELIQSSGFDVSIFRFFQNENPNINASVHVLPANDLSLKYINKPFFFTLVNYGSVEFCKKYISHPNFSGIISTSIECYEHLKSFTDKIIFVVRKYAVDDKYLCTLHDSNKIVTVVNNYEIDSVHNYSPKNAYLEFKKVQTFTDKRLDIILHGSPNNFVHDFIVFSYCRYLLHIKYWGHVCNAVVRALSLGIPVLLDRDTYNIGKYSAYLENNSNCIVFDNTEDIIKYLNDVELEKENYSKLKNYCLDNYKKYRFPFTENEKNNFSKLANLIDCSTETKLRPCVYINKLYRYGIKDIKTIDVQFYTTGNNISITNDLCCGDPVYGTQKYLYDTEWNIVCQEYDRINIM